MDNKLTEREKIALHYHVLTSYDNWAVLYAISHPNKDIKGLTPKSLNTYISKWKKSAAVQDCIKEYQYIERCKEEERRKNEPEPETRDITVAPKREVSPAGSGFVNLLDRDTFLQEINKGANSATDEKDKREYLKMISDNLRYKDNETGENNEIQRFYTPLTCQNCVLYQNQKDKKPE